MINLDDDLRSCLQDVNTGSTYPFGLDLWIRTATEYILYKSVLQTASDLPQVDWTELRRVSGEQSMQQARPVMRAHRFDPLTLQPSSCLKIGLSRCATRAAHGHWRSNVRAAQHIPALRDDAQQRNGQDFQHVLYLHDLATPGANWIIAGEKQMLVDAAPVLGYGRLGVEHADDAIRIPDRGHLRIDDHDRHIGMPHRQDRSLLDPGRAVADHPVELRPQLRDDLRDPLLGQAILVPAL